MARRTARRRSASSGLTLRTRLTSAQFELGRGFAREAEGLADLHVQHGVFHGALDVATIDGPPFRLIGVEQALVGMALQHCGQFPAEVLRILDAAGQSEAAGGRMAMRGVADQEHAPGAEARPAHPRAPSG